MNARDRRGCAITLRARLEESRKRCECDLRLRGLAWSGVVALCSFGLLELTRYVSAESALPALLSAEAHWAVAVSVLAVGLVLTWFHARRATPPLLEIARRADRRFALDERVSTATEVELQGAGITSPTPLLALLLEDAERYAVQVRPEALVPFQIPRPSWYLIPVTVAILTLKTAPPVMVAGGISVNDTVSVAEFADAIEAATVFIRQAAEEDLDSYLLAVANAMKQLSEDIADGSLSGQDAEEELARLLEHAHTAIGAERNRPDADGGGPYVSMEDAVQPEELGMISGDLGAEGDGAGPGGNHLGVSTDTRMALEDLVNRLEQDRGIMDSTGGDEPLSNAPGAAGGEGSTSDTEPPFPADQSPLGQNAMAVLRLPEDVPGEMQGGAPGDGAGAGTGSEYLLPDSGLGLLPDPVDRQEIEVALDGGVGPREQVFIPPEARYTAIHDVPPSAGNWRRFPEGPVNSESLGLANRAAVSRYFLSIKQLSAAGMEP